MMLWFSFMRNQIHQMINPTICISISSIVSHPTHMRSAKLFMNLMRHLLIGLLHLHVFLWPPKTLSLIAMSLINHATLMMVSPMALNMYYSTFTVLFFSAFAMSIFPTVFVTMIILRLYLLNVLWLVMARWLFFMMLDLLNHAVLLRFMRGGTSWG